MQLRISCTGPKSDLCGTLKTIACRAQARIQAAWPINGCGLGTRLSSSNFVGRGYHSIRIKAASGPGVVSTFYLSNNGGLYDKRLNGHDSLVLLPRSILLYK